MSAALFLQHAMHVRRIILSSVACLSVPYFSTLSHKRHDFRKKNVIENKLPLLIFSTIILWNVSLSKKKWVRYYKCTSVFMYSTLYYCQILIKFKFSWKTKKKIISSSVYDCTVEDVEYIYNKLSIHIQQQNYSHRLNLL